MIRIERNTDNLFSLLQFIAFVINTVSFNRRFYSKRLPRKCKTTSRKEERGFELATMQIQTGRGNLCTSGHLPSGIHTYISPYKHPNTPCSHSGGGVEFCHDYGLVFFISVHAHLLLASGEKKALFFEFRTIIPLENHGFGDRPFLPFEVGRARAIALISLAWLELTT